MKAAAASLLATLALLAPGVAQSQPAPQKPTSQQSRIVACPDSVPDSLNLPSNFARVDGNRPQQLAGAALNNGQFLCLYGSAVVGFTGSQSCVPGGGAWSNGGCFVAPPGAFSAQCTATCK